ncbi:MAG: hypothetical protein U0575_12070 [Phycisphaerales bacterium]
MRSSNQLDGWLLRPFAAWLALALTSTAFSAGTALTDDRPPLDPRINPAKITESDPPPMPGAVAQPLPAIHRIADGHGADTPMSAEHFAKARAAVERGLAFLRTRQSPGGAWMVKAQAAPTGEPAKTEPVALAVTGLALKALAQAPGTSAAGAGERGPDGPPRDPAAARAVALLLRARGPNGLYDGEQMTTYVHSCIASGLASVGGAEVADALQAVVAALKTGIWEHGEGLDVRQDWYGGAGYGKSGRPDLSNTQLMLDALHDAGVSPDDPAVQATIAFVSRTQNLKATNGSAWAQAGANDGGFVYTAANGGESMASEAANEGRAGEKLPAGTPRSLRSYGSMTYAGFKSMLYAGLSRDDVRVRAAWDWLRRHFTFDENPGLGQQGLFYYYAAMSRALVAAQQPTIAPLRDGVESTPVNWREAMIDSLTKRQRDDGSWVNSADRWMEGDPEMCTIDAVLALEEALKPAGGR